MGSLKIRPFERITMTATTDLLGSVLSPWARNIAPSPTLAVDAKAKALKAAGKDVCGFGAGEPDFDTPDFIKEACIEALRAVQTKYVPASGVPALRKAIADEHNARGFFNVTAENVVVSPGGKYSCYLTILALVGPGDEVIIPAPFWVSYTEMVKLAGGTPVLIETHDDTDFKITPAQLKAAITPKTKLLILNSPSNPTGSVYDASSLRGIVDTAMAAKLTVMSDEIYEHLLYDGVTHTSPATFSPEIAKHVVTVSGFAKTFSMTGWRLGTVVAPLEIARAIGDLQSQTTSNATTFAQYGALAALQKKEDAAAAIEHMRTSFDRRRKMLWEGLNAIPGITCRRPGGAFYVFPNIASFGLSSTEFSARLLEEELVAVVPGVAFGADAYVRLSYAVDDGTIAKGLERLARFCAKLAHHAKK